MDPSLSYLWGSLLEFLSTERVLVLRLVDSNARRIIDPFVAKSLIIRIPFGEQIRTICPLTVIVYSPQSIPSSCSQVVLILLNTSYLPPNLPLPPNVIELTLKHFNEPCARLPSTLTHLATSDSFNYPIDHRLPSTLTHLTVGRSFNQPVNQLPSALTFLHLGGEFDKPVDKLPLGLIYLKTANMNQAVDNLPPTLKYLHLGGNFNYKLDKLPPSLLCLNTGRSFNLPINNLPPNLKELHLGRTFDQPVNQLPPQLLVLTVGSNFTHPTTNLPPSLIYFSSGPLFNQIRTDEQPMLEVHPKQNTIDFDKLIPRLIDHPSSADSYHSFAFPYYTLHEINFGSIPESLKRLTMNVWYDSEIRNLPLKLTSLFLGRSFNHPLDLPQTLTHLTLGNSFNQPIDLPLGLSHFTTGNWFNQPLELPPTLIQLVFGTQFNKPLNLPPRLTYLEFPHNSCFLQPLTLPPMLANLSLGQDYNLPIENFPRSLLKLTTSRYYPLATSIPPAATHYERFVENSYWEVVRIRKFWDIFNLLYL